MKRLLGLLALLLLLVLTVNISANYHYYLGGGDWVFSISFSLSLITLGWGGYVMLYYWFFRKRLNWKRYPDFSLAASVLLSGVYGIFMMICSMKLLTVTGIFREDKPPEQYITNCIYAALFAMLLGLVINGQDFLKEWKKSTEENEQIKLEMLQVQYAALKNQVQPHFFFNSLNTLNSLISGDPVLAKRFLNCLSRVFRYALQQGNKPTVLLSEEIKVVEDYLFIFRQRFEDKLNISVNISDNAAAAHIIIYALLTLVENAIKHNEISTAYPLSIEICDEGNYLIVSNSFQPKQNTEEGTGIGLHNITERYRLFTDYPVMISRDQLFTVKIPLLTL